MSLQVDEASESKNSVKQLSKAHDDDYGIASDISKEKTFELDLKNGQPDLNHLDMPDYVKQIIKAQSNIITSL